MKKIFLAGALAIAGLSNAQVKFGIKGGYSLSNLRISDVGTSVAPEARSTFYVGGLVEHKPSDKFGIQGEILYTSLGAKVSHETNISGYYLRAESTSKLGTISVPISGKYYPTEQLAILLGLNFNFLVSAQEDNKLDSNIPYTNNLLGLLNTGKDTKDYYKTFSLGPFIGLEYNFSNGLFVDTRYNLGVTNISNVEGYGLLGTNPKAFNRYWQIGLGYKF